MDRFAGTRKLDENNKFQTEELHIRSNSYIANYYNIRSKSISQLYQDVNVITFFNKKEKLFFVDIGANDGINMSNTCLLEKLAVRGTAFRFVR